MVKIPAGFDADKEEQLGEFQALPEGKYLVIIADSEEKDNSNTPGSHTALTLQVVEGDHKGKPLWENLNLNNPNQQAVQIARARLSSICHATGVMKPADTSELHDIPFVVKVACRKYTDRDGNPKMSNEIKSYEAATKHSPPDDQSTDPAEGQPAQDAAEEEAPWNK